MRKSVALAASLSLLLLASLPLATQGLSLMRSTQDEAMPLLNAATSSQKPADYVDLTHAVNAPTPIWQAAGLPAVDPTHAAVVVDNSGKVKKGSPVMLVAIGLVKEPGAAGAVPRVLAVRSVDSFQTALAIIEPPATPAPKQAHLLKRNAAGVTKSTL